MYIVLGSVIVTQALHHFNLLWKSSYALTALTTYLAAALAYYGLWRIILWPNFISPLRAIDGPKSHWFYGHFKRIFKEPVGVPHLEFLKQYPTQPFVRYHGLFKAERLLANTQSAHQYILTHCYDYPKPQDISFALKTILGAEGILFVEGDVHKRQRKQMNPSFSYGKLKSMTSIFWSKATKLVDAWRMLSKDTAEIEVLSGLSAATLDIIGSAGFGYEFDALDMLTDPTKQNKLAAAYADMFNMKKGSRLLGVLVFYFPWMRRIPFPRHVELNHDIATVTAMSGDIVAKKVAQLENGEDIGNDIFALLLKDNHRKASEKDQSDPPMTHREISDQTTTLLAAGHETTSAATTWALHALSMNQDIQDRLRDEILAAVVEDETPSFEKIESLHYLNNVVREVLRFYPPVPMTRRVAQVSATIDGAYVPAGTDIFIAPAAVNKNPHIWGADGEVFNPDRWDNLPSTMNNYGMETFLHGARGCIGQRFAIVEMKCLLAALIARLKFEPKQGHTVESQSSITMRPKGGLPLIITKVSH